MASKGSKTGGTVPAAPKPAARPAKPAAPKAKPAAPAAEKTVPAATTEAVAPVLPIEPVPTPEAVPQPVIETVTEATAEPVAAVVEIVAEAAAAAEPAVQKETAKMETTFEANTQKAQAFFADFNDRTKVAVEKSTKLVEEMNDFAKGNLEAIVESGRITAKGMETLGHEAADYGRKSFESATAALKGLAAVKSPTEFFKLQSDFMRSAFDSYVAEASKNTEAMIKLAGDAAQPLSSRIAVAVEKAKVAA